MREERERERASERQRERERNRETREREREREGEREIDSVFHGPKLGGAWEGRANFAPEKILGERAPAKSYDLRRLTGANWAFCPKIKAKMAKFPRSHQRCSRVSSKYLRPRQIGSQIAQKWLKSAKFFQNCDNGLLKYATTDLRALKRKNGKFLPIRAQPRTFSCGEGEGHAAETLT